MADLHRRERIYRRLLAVADMAAAAAVAPLAIGVFGGRGLPAAYVILIPVIVLAAKILGLYDHDDLVVGKSTLHELPALVNLALAFSLVVWIARVATVGGTVSAGGLVGLCLALAAVLGVSRVVARALALAISPAERCLVLGDAAALDRLRGPLAHRRGVCLVGCFPLARALDDEAALRALAAAQSVHRVIVATDDTLLPQDVLELVCVVKAAGLRVSLLPGLLEATGSSVVHDEIGGLAVLGMPLFGLTRSSRAVKRGFDLIGSLLLVGLTAPIVAVAAVLIRLDTPGPAFFRQTRVGRDGRHFQMIKLRTMVDGAEDLKAGLLHRNETDGVFKIADDPRITRVGRWLRRPHVDELPQLLNVLRGEMSLVGPRPLVTDEDEQVLGLDRRRLHLSPGMTGPWQTLGNRVPLAEMVKVDYLYITNWSLWLDLKILLRTAAHVARGRGR